MNLGWKLAAQVRGRSPAGLLDTYQSERRPVGLRVIMHTQAQGMLVGPGPRVTALRTLFGEMLEDTSTLRRIAGLIAGADLAYDGVGGWAPDVTLHDGTRLAELTRTGRPLLLHRPGDGLDEVAAGWRDRVDAVAAPGAGPAMLLRPDCYVAWREGEPAAALRTALTRWFSAPATATA
ncbi:aromatic-ring hydroxylase C-terminal domain-containing protein [Mangrovihabitans endophyticus]|uniref:FAD-binding domain-containing protein n=1 Tax=Mangrovihabitans endophyticus TaxID=1751298 RepID=A0A8J3C027_9ACTN|nr:FAD-dependent monooxygenase [Mangrovihabitans endophyticus]GGK91482.1 hypothetical protein GCM10012284_26680 [Mangrovihabitans endophyticus]